jgi:hypothetical protein
MVQVDPGQHVTLSRSLIQEPRTSGRSCAGRQIPKLDPTNPSTRITTTAASSKPTRERPLHVSKRASRAVITPRVRIARRFRTHALFPNGSRNTGGGSSGAARATSSMADTSYMYWLWRHDMCVNNKLQLTTAFTETFALPTHHHFCLSFSDG